MPPQNIENLRKRLAAARQMEKSLFRSLYSSPTVAPFSNQFRVMAHTLGTLSAKNIPKLKKNIQGEARRRGIARHVARRWHARTQAKKNTTVTLASLRAQLANLTNAAANGNNGRVAEIFNKMGNNWTGVAPHNMRTAANIMNVAQKIRYG
jgi:hypothetical protein